MANEAPGVETKIIISCPVSVGGLIILQNQRKNIHRIF